MSQYADVIMMMDARERRVLRQQELLAQYHLPLISFSMNIAGPFKNSPLFTRGFLLGRDTLLEQLGENKAAVVWSEEISEGTGCEGIYVVDAGADLLKEITCAIEEATPFGRLYDMDVLAEDGRKLDRPEPRRSLLYEVCVTPKPGLVDRVNNGSHRDMDIYTFLSSASAPRS